MSTSTLPPSADYRESFNRHVFRAVPEKSHCLDIGCWTGNLGKLLIEKKGCIVDGVDVADGVLEEARKNGYADTFRVNLNGEVLDPSLFKKKYDVIIFADVLEHLVYPLGALKFFSQFLAPNGRMIISLPNVAFILNRLRLLLGNWDYQDFGTLDKTHLRFYTLQSSQALIREAGLELVSFRPYNQFGILRHFDPPLFPSLFAYQMLLIVKLPKK